MHQYKKKIDFDFFFFFWASNKGGGGALALQKS